MFNNFFIFIYYCLYFKKSIIVILCKYGGNKNFISQKDHRSIKLLNIINQIIDVILAIKISYIVTAHHLLLNTYFSNL